MAENGAKEDRHFPLYALDNPIRRLFGGPRKYCRYVQQDQIVADLGCGPGFYTLPLAESVGANFFTYASACEDSSAGMIPSAFIKS